MPELYQRPATPANRIPPPVHPAPATRPFSRVTARRGELMTHKALSERATGQQACRTKGVITMRKKDPEKIIKDLEDYRMDGDRQRLLD